ncbi:MAG: protein translocase subunit SecD, partial [Flavobacteriales bacterium]|nr:protein translocase subunit SecD [Flavobacteriales bacterium]
MQNKSAIWVFTILLALACAYQISFTFVASGVESDAEAFGASKADSIGLVDDNVSEMDKAVYAESYRDEYLVSKSEKSVYPLLGFTYNQVKKFQINLGLDLQGGMSVTLEVSVVDVLRSLAKDTQDESFKKAISRAREMQKDSQEEFVALFAKAWDETNPSVEMWTAFHSRENKDKFPRNMAQVDLVQLLAEEAEAAISQTEQVIRKRIDNLGVVQPKVQRLEGTGRIIVELPGVKDKSRVRDLLQSTAKLEFWEANKNDGIYNKFIEANDIIALTQNKKQGSSTEASIEKDTTSLEGVVAIPDSTIVKDTAATELSILEELKGDDSAEGSDSTAAAAADEQLTDAERKAKFPLTSILFANLTSDNTQFAEGPFIGFARVRDTSQVNTYLAMKKVKVLFPKTKFFWEAKPFPLSDGSQSVRLLSVKVTKRDGTAPMGGDAISSAASQVNQLGQPEVSMRMTSDGSTKWKNMTAEAAKNNPGYVAIILDGLVYSAPSVREEIAGGSTSISGSFTVQETKDLANVLKSGKLGASANIIEEAIVGPSLGKKSVDNGLMSFIIALAVVLAYMVFYYAKAGIAADIALAANIFFVVGVLASIGATLTLPGIAGIVLTIGMSVDANVLIYERIREEMAQGKGQRLAIVDGYNNAYSSI